MDKTYSITISAERKRGQHLDAEARGALQQLHKLGYSNRAIARVLNCSPSTVGYELRRGTPEYSGRGRKPGYSAKRGGAVYKANRLRCRRPKTVPRCSTFIDWTAAQVLMFADEINDTPTKRLGYRTPEELFEVELDRIYAVA